MVPINIYKKSAIRIGNKLFLILIYKQLSMQSPCFLKFHHVPCHLGTANCSKYNEINKGCYPELYSRWYSRWYLR